MKHTPGPWEQGRFNIEVKPGLYYCLNNSSDTSAHELSANAKLIATAPYMLQSLQAIRKIIDGSQPIDIPGAIMVIDNAVSKAIGG